MATARLLLRDWEQTFRDWSTPSSETEQTKMQNAERMIRQANRSAISNGTDAYIHDGTVRGVFRELGSVFVRSGRQPTVLQVSQIYRVLRSNFKNILRKAGARDPFNARACSRNFVLSPERRPMYW